MRLIDADKLPFEPYGEDVISWYATGWNDAINVIDRAPTVDAEPVRHGEWIKTRKHLWKKDDDGEVDEWAWESGFHNGVHCNICYKSICVHCEPDYDEKQDCREHYMCSECGRVVLDLEPYCHCGAKMDGGKQDAERND